MADESAKNQCQGSARRKFWARWLVLLIITIGIAAYPISNAILRATLLCCGLLLWVGLLMIVWPTKWLRFALILLPLLIVVSFVLPGKPPEKRALQGAYIRSLRKYSGTRYIWGGENRLGIDCSGLVRAGLINADFTEALRTCNPALLRAGAALWWNDCSARALGEGYKNQTSYLFEAASLNDANYAQLQPGDLAITGDGIHVLAYLGGTTWIEADPQQHRVVIIDVPTKDPWFSCRAQLVRWRQLDSRL